MIQKAWRIHQRLVKVNKPWPGDCLSHRAQYNQWSQESKIVPALDKIDFISHTPQQTTRLGFRLGQWLASGDVLCLAGNLGAGKTALAQGIGAGWGALEAVTSPTFTLIHEHRRAADEQVFYHVDCYRLASAVDAWGIGLEDLLHADGAVVIEWPEHIQAMLPAERLWITLTFVDDMQRRIGIQATGARYVKLVESLRQSVSAR
jgi:tRNA threonylcarbamoyladenosine biosynthesis protein TsaE